MSEETEELDFGGRLNVGWRSILSPFDGGKSENQDNYLIIDANGRTCSLKDQKEVYSQMPDWPKGHIRLAVLDGLGGHDNGRGAAEEVVQWLKYTPACFTVRGLALSMQEIHKQLHSNFSNPAPEAKIPGTTLTLLEFDTDGDAMLYHNGDSRLIKVTSAATEVLTIDHVPATQSAIYGKLDEDEWKERVLYKNQNVIRQAMIMGNALYAPDGASLSLSPKLYPLIGDNLKNATFLKNKEDHRVISLDKNAVYLLASDGLWDRYKPWEFLQKIPSFIFSGQARSMSSRVDDIVMEHVLASDDLDGGDNTTVVGFELVAKSSFSKIVTSPMGEG